MAILRYVKTPEQVAKASAENPEFMESTVYSIRCVYETDPAIHRAVLPQPHLVRDAAGGRDRLGGLWSPGQL